MHMLVLDIVITSLVMEGFVYNVVHTRPHMARRELELGCHLLSLVVNYEDDRKGPNFQV